MADTAKKSRIVSEKEEQKNKSGDDEDDLEGALMEEFNMRLKTCMSQDDLHGNGDSADEGGGNGPSNGYHGNDADVVSISISDDFIRVEQEQCQRQNGQQPTTVKSVKDKMFLSTDTSNSCLLFTQTVTSPMLTPSEEHVDFLKGFEASKNESPDEVATEEHNQPIYENVSESLYENVDKTGTPLVPSNPSREVVEEESIYENLPATAQNNQVIYENVSPVKTDDDKCDTSDSVEKDQSVENKSEDDDEEEDDSSQQVSESYVETSSTTTTTTYHETSMASLEEGSKTSSTALKKKKTKKSRKEEKENISVNETNNNNATNKGTTVEESTYYNVDVKNLCRSFGDLSRFAESAPQATVTATANCAENADKTTLRARSMPDVTARSLAYTSLLDAASSTNCRSLDLTENNNNMDNNNKRVQENVFGGVCVRALKSSFNKFDALQKKNLLHVRSSDSTRAQEKFNNGSSQQDISSTNCRSCDKPVFQMEQIKAEKSIWHKNCFRCNECNKQLNVDTYESHEATLYCKPHFKALFAPKAVEDDAQPRSRKPELIIRENQPLELPPDVVRASDKPDLGLEELQALNVKERFQVFENYQQQEQHGAGDLERSPVNVKRSASILSKLARFQSKGMDVGVSDDALNGIPIEPSSSEAEQSDVSGNEDEDVDGEDEALVRAKRVQKEKPFHFTGMSDVKSKWENQGEEQHVKDERREERKQEIQSIRNRLFMGKQGKMKEAYQQAILESSGSSSNIHKEKIESCDTKSLKERFEKGEVIRERETDAANREDDETEVYESEISKKSRSLFQELDANASKPPQVSAPVPKLDVKKAREAYLSRTATDDVVSSERNGNCLQESVEVVKTAEIQQRFKFFETYREPEKERKQFRITPPRDGQVKGSTPDREPYRDPDVVRAEDGLHAEEDSLVAVQSHTATKMLSKFRQMQEEVCLGQQQQHQQLLQQTPAALRPLKRFTPPLEPSGGHTGDTDSGNEGESDEDEEDEDEVDREEVEAKYRDDDLIEAQKAARAKQLRAKFERWEANEIRKEQNNSSVNLIEELGDQQSQIESTKSLRARFESMRESTNQEANRMPRVKVNRFVEMVKIEAEVCESCTKKVYPLEKICVHNHIYHRSCFKCMECNCVLRMDSYAYNQGQLYCTPHFKRLFIAKGNYDTGFGFGQHKEKWNSNAAQSVV